MKFVAFDTETGDIDPSQGDLLTASFVITDENFNVIDSLDLKLKPDDGRLPLANIKALQVNGIVLKDHMADPSTVAYKEGTEILTSFLKKHLKRNGRYSNLVPLGYNIGFDIDYIFHYLMNKKEWESILHYKSYDIMQWVDMLKLSGWMPKDVGSLTSCIDFLGLQKRDAHNARGDILMTIDLAKKILEIMESRKDGGQQQDLISLLETE